MHKHEPAPIKVQRVDSRRLVAKVDGRGIGSCYAYGPSFGFPLHMQWARAFLAACCIAPIVAGVRK